MKNDNCKYLCSARLLTELVTLEDEKRKVRYLSPYAPGPTVAQQIAGVLIIGTALATIVREKNKAVSIDRVIDLLLWHDAPETRYGDLGRDQRRYLFINEDKTRTDIFGSVPWGLEIIELIENFEAGGDDINIKIARDADALYVVSTIKDILDQGYPINQPDVRILKTLNRLSTEEGFSLGKEMAAKKPDQIWKLVKGYAGINGKISHPEQSLFTLLTTIWTLIELRNKVGRTKIKREKIMQAVIRNDRQLQNSIRNIISDSEKIYRLINTKKLFFAPKSKSKVRFSIASMKTPEGKKLALAIYGIDLFDWWNLMMGYLSLNPDGTLAEKLR